MKIQVGGEFPYKLIDHFDSEKINTRELSFSKELVSGDVFEVDDVTYEVGEVISSSLVHQAVIRMTRYKIPSTTTQFVHKCPAKKSMVDALDRDDVVKLEAKVGPEKLSRIKGGRVKMRAYNAIEQQCPLCKVVFWKEQTLLPDTVAVAKVVGKKKKTKTKKAVKKKAIKKKAKRKVRK